MSEIPSAGSYHRVDRNINDCNIVERELYRELIDKTCEVLTKACADHCGPNATYAILEDLVGSGKTTFSKDGIDIINSIGFVNSTQDTVRRLLAYCASNSDRIVGDGTTSAMLISISVLKQLNAVLSDFEAQGKMVPFHKFRKEYERFASAYADCTEGQLTIDEIIEKMKSDTFGTENQAIISTFSDENLFKIVVYHVAYMQAYISSHGDRELALSVASMFMHTPKDSWNHIFFKKSIFEKDVRFQSEHTTDQFITTAKVMHKSMLNHSIGGKIRMSNATLVALPHPILCSQLRSFGVLRELIEDHVINKKELLIIHSKVLDEMTSNMLNTIFETLKDQNKYNTTVAILRHDPILENLNDISVLNFLCKKMPTSEDEMFNVFKGVNDEGIAVEFDQFTLRLNNLYPNPENSMIHPYYDDPSFPLFKDCAEHIKDYITQYTSSGPSYTKRDDVMNFHELYNKMKYTQRVIITVGGQTHDSLSAVPVIKDAIYATRATLQKGFELGGAVGLLKKCSGIHASLVDSANTGFSAIHVSKAFIEAVHALHSIIYAQCEEQIYTSADQIYDIYSNRNVTLDTVAQIIQTAIVNGCVGNDIFDMSKVLIPLDDHIVPIQPKEINQVIVKRFGDLFIKMLNASKIISVGGIVLADKE